MMDLSSPCVSLMYSQVSPAEASVPLTKHRLPEPDYFSRVVVPQWADDRVIYSVLIVRFSAESPDDVSLPPPNTRWQT